MKVLAKGGDPAGTKISELAEGTPVTVDADASIEDVIDVMSENQIRRLPVLEDKKLVGIVSQADVAKELPEKKVGDMVEAISKP